jgi:small-conductance mechanosensitive channel
VTNKTGPVLPIVEGDYQDQMGSFLHDGWHWLLTHWLHILIATGIATALVLLFRLARHWGVKACRRGDGVATWYAIFGRALGKTGNFFMVMAAAKLVIGYAHAPAAISATATFFFTIAAVFQAAVWVREIVFGVIEYRAISEGASESLVSALGIIRLLVTIVLFAVALVVVLSNLGVNVTGLVAGLGVGGIAIGLAAQGIFADLFAALAILFDRPFHVGQTISYDKTTGTVERIGLKSTRVRTGAGELRIIANKSLLDKEIANVSERAHRRVTFVLSIARWVPAETLRAIPDMLKQIVEAHSGCTFVHAGFIAFGASSYDVQVEFDTGPGFPEFYQARHEVGLAIVARFTAEKIDLAYPTQTGVTAPPEGGPTLPNSPPARA